MKTSILSCVFVLSASTLVAAGPFAAVARIATKVVPKVVKAASHGGGGNNNNNNKKGKRDFFDDDEFEALLMTRDHSIQEWIDLTYNPTAGTGISPEVLGLLAQLGRTPPAPGTQCPTRTNRIPQFSHKLTVSETVAIPRDQAVQALTIMTQQTNPANKLFFAALEVAMQLNCWTVPADIKAIVDAKGWMQQVTAAQAGGQQAPAPQSLAQAPVSAAAPPAQAPPSALPGAQPVARSIEDDDFEFDLFGRDLLDEDDFAAELYVREAEAEADAEFDLWARDAFSFDSEF